MSATRHQGPCSSLPLQLSPRTTLPPPPPFKLQQPTNPFPSPSNFYRTATTEAYTCSGPRSATKTAVALSSCCPRPRAGRWPSACSVCARARRCAPSASPASPHRKLGLSWRISDGEADCVGGRRLTGVDWDGGMLMPAEPCQDPPTRLGLVRSHLEPSRAMIEPSGVPGRVFGGTITLGGGGGTFESRDTCAGRLNGSI